MVLSRVRLYTVKITGISQDRQEKNIFNYAITLVVVELQLSAVLIKTKLK